MGVKRIGNPLFYFDEGTRRHHRKGTGPQAGTKVEIDVVDHGFNGMIEWMMNFGRVEVKIGVIGTNAVRDHGDGITNGELAMIHEYGAPKAKIPQRSFIRSAVDENEKKYQKTASKLLKKAFASNTSPMKASALLGEVIKGDIQDRMVSGKITPPIKEKTIRAKGGDTAPLVDDGTLVNAIDFEVKRVQR